MANCCKTCPIYRVSMRFLASSASTARPVTTAISWTMSAAWTLRPQWRDFVEELCGDTYRNFICRLLDVSHVRFRFHWHFTPNGGEVSPHCDSKGKIGSQIFYLNTDATGSGIGVARRSSWTITVASPRTTRPPSRTLTQSTRPRPETIAAFSLAVGAIPGTACGASIAPRITTARYSSWCSRSIGRCVWP